MRAIKNDALYVSSVVLLFRPRQMGFVVVAATAAVVVLQRHNLLVDV